MKRLADSAICGLVAMVGLYSHQPLVYGHHSQHPAVVLRAQTAPVPNAKSSNAGVSGQGKLRFKVLVTSEQLPQEAKKVLVSAHGGFAVDLRQGKVKPISRCQVPEFSRSVLI
jgi:hypothetical protein